MVNVITDFKDLESKAFNPDKPIRLTDKNIKVSERGYIYICKYMQGVRLRISTNLKATIENLNLVKREAKSYISKELAKQGFHFENNKEAREADEYLHDSFLYFLRDLEPKVKETTFAKHKMFLHAIKKEFLHKRTNSLDKHFLYNYALILHKKGQSRCNIIYKIATLVRVINNYRQAFNLQKILLQDINIKGLGQQIKEKRAFTEIEIEKILNASVKDKEFHNYLMIATHTGARVGEILALTKDDIKNDCITIHKAKNNLNKITTPKTKSSIRNIPFINEDFKSFMENLANEDKYNLFERLNRKAIQTKWNSLLKSLNIEQSPVYRLRHTFATLAITKSKNILAVSQILGHSNPNITLTSYAIAKQVKIDSFDIRNKEELCTINQE